MMLHFRKLISTFYYNHPNKPTATFLTIDFAPLIARLIVKPGTKASSIKQKHCLPTKANGNNKHTKKSWTSSLLSRFLALS